MTNLFNLTIKKQEVSNDLSVCMLNILPKVKSLLCLLAINLVKVEIQIFQTVMRPHFGHLIKGSYLGASYTKLAPCLVWYQYIFWGWRYVFYLLRDPTRLLRWYVLHIYGWQLLATCHHPEKFDDHRHYDSEEKKCSTKYTNLINLYYQWKIEFIG